METRFPFGRNWQRFLAEIDDHRIADAQASLRAMLERPDLTGRSFLDVGSGSGLFSLAARRLGARVHSFDYDPESVACTSELRQRFAPDDPEWTIERGSALDAGYLASLGAHDVVYSWGVLHHTGDMWTALDRVVTSVKPGGLLFIALYNDQGATSAYWRRVKLLYNRGAGWCAAVVALHVPYLIGARWLVRAVGRKGQPPRGMALWRDMHDWLGGYPFEVASPGSVVAHLRPRKLTLARLVTCGGRHGCNEMVFRRQEQ